MTESSQHTPPEPHAPQALYTVAIIFIVLAASFVFDIWGAITPVEQNAPVDLKYVQKKTVRDPLTDGLKLKKAGFEYNCSSCHQHFTLSDLRGNRVAEHTKLVLNHGANKECMNCHNKANLETFVAHDGSEIQWTETVQLCRKCHGPKYRDWVAGVHGRPNGFWDVGRGPSVKATCVACHDPHEPAFQPVAPAPGPNERRGTASAPSHDHDATEHEEHAKHED